MVFCNAIILHTALTFKGGEVVVMEAFGAHFMKDVSRGQLTSAAKSLLSSKQRKSIASMGAEKSHFISRLAKEFLHRKIVHNRKNASLNSLCRNNVKKVGPF